MECSEIEVAVAAAMAERPLSGDSCVRTPGLLSRRRYGLGGHELLNFPVIRLASSQNGNLVRYNDLARHA